MSGILHRLAGQALGAQTKDAPRIRPAASVHAHVPLSESRDSGTVAPGIPVWAGSSGAPADSQKQDLAQRVSGGIAPRMQAAEPKDSGSGAERARQMRNAYAPSPAKSEVSPGLPEPLLDDVQIEARPAIAPLTHPVSVIRAESKDSRAEPTEVHVHIGRIEVIAAPAPATPKKSRTAPARNTLPLTDYLARRRPS